MIDGIAVPALGRMYKAILSCSIDKGIFGIDTPKVGKCVYVHPDMRFVVLEFKNNVREAFPLMEIAPVGGKQ